MLTNFKFGPVVQEEMSFKRFLIWSSGGPCVLWSGTKYFTIYITIPHIEPGFSSGELKIKMMSA